MDDEEFAAEVAERERLRAADGRLDIGCASRVQAATTSRRRSTSTAAASRPVRGCEQCLGEQPAACRQSRGVAFLVLLAALAAEGRTPAPSNRSRAGRASRPPTRAGCRTRTGRSTSSSGYMNRNWEQVAGSPGRGRRTPIEPGGPRPGPADPLPARGGNRFVFQRPGARRLRRRRVGVDPHRQRRETQRAYGTLRRDYFIDDLVIQGELRGRPGPPARPPELAERTRLPC